VSAVSRAEPTAGSGGGDADDDDLVATSPVPVWQVIGLAAVLVLGLAVVASLVLNGLGLMPDLTAMLSSPGGGAAPFEPSTPSARGPSRPLASGTAAGGQAETPVAPRAGSIPTRAFQLWKDLPFDPFADGLDQVRQFQPARVIPSGFDITDGATLVSEAMRIRLAGIVPLPASAICLSDQSTKIACGLMARASLANLANAGPLLCNQDVSLDTDKPLYLCRTHAGDLALAQIEAGFALPVYRSLAIMEALTAAAAARRAGGWNGGWTILTPSAAPVLPAGPAP
jgi:endonuclease YncB( thermonuclease family)